MNTKGSKGKKQKYSTKKLDVLFSRIIRARGYCSSCGATKRLQCAHVISRKYHQIRWDFTNAIPLCSACHLRFTYDPLGWELYIEKSFGKKFYLDLREKALQYNKIDKEKIYLELKKREEHVKRLFDF